MTKPKDDFEAVRIVVETIEAFEPEDQKRILRWAMEKVGLANPIPSSGPAISDTQVVQVSTLNSVAGSSTDIKSFIQEKNPQSDMHFAATVAYYHRFQAPPGERKNEIGSEDLQEATRLSNRQRLVSPVKTLHNALGAGLLNKGTGRGSYTINTVGENLVAMSLPLSGASSPKKVKSGVKKSKSKRKK